MYQGEALGLPEAMEIPDEFRQDPTWFRTEGERYGRDGCRVPLPWSGTAPSYGFNDTGASWLPQPAEWAEYARAREDGSDTSTLALYRELLRLRKERGLGSGSLVWEDLGSDAVAFRRGELHIAANLGSAPLALPSGATVLVHSAPDAGTVLPPDSAAWYTRG